MLTEVQSTQSRKTTLALLALSVGGFGIGLTEFIIAGLLTEVAGDLGVSITTAGNLVGVYAVAVVPGALIITPFLMKRPPKIFSHSSSTCTVTETSSCL